MIPRRTVLVLGAGASVPYGFPTGRGLLINVVRSLRNEGGTLQIILSALGFELGEIRTFAEELDRSMQPSVDAFIENRPEFMNIGKAAIVGTLVPSEDEGKLLVRGEQMLWYEYLFNKMAENRNDYEQSHLSIVTLNYDRSFEHFLFHALKSSFHLADAEGLELLNRTPHRACIWPDGRAQLCV
jgi:hypothetical protein